MFLHSDFYVTKNWDIELLKIHKNYPDEKFISYEKDKINKSLSPRENGIKIKYYNNYMNLYFFIY